MGSGLHLARLLGCVGMAPTAKSQTLGGGGLPQALVPATHLPATGQTLGTNGALEVITLTLPV